MGTKAEVSLEQYSTAASPQWYITSGALKTS